jgi:XTP/dITP diphosphohydrolase
MQNLLLATRNHGKIEELKGLLRIFEMELITPGDLGLENATRKAAAFAASSGLMALADDSGLEVKALGGAPGIYSARYSPKPGADDKDRRDYLLSQLDGSSKPWLARFHCTVALALPDGEIHFSEGNCAGEIIPVERGDAGFGYDPIFLVSGLDKTMAELSMADKNQISHRAQAIKAMLPTLLAYL